MQGSELRAADGKRLLDERLRLGVVPHQVVKMAQTVETHGHLRLDGAVDLLEDRPRALEVLPRGGELTETRLHVGQARRAAPKSRMPGAQGPVAGGQGG